MNTATATGLLVAPVPGLHLHPPWHPPAPAPGPGDQDGHGHGDNGGDDHNDDEDEQRCVLCNVSGADARVGQVKEQNLAQ